MITKITCKQCGSTNCEKSAQRVSKQKAALYPENVTKVECSLCYDCGWSVVTYYIT